MSKGRVESTVLDTSVLLELAVDSPKSRSLSQSILEESVRPITGELNIAELSYVLCRRFGPQAASRSIALLKGSGQVTVLDCSEFMMKAADIKCRRSLSLVDCVTIAMGESLGVPVLFSTREKELDAELRKLPFMASVNFLD